MLRDSPPRFSYGSTLPTHIPMNPSQVSSVFLAASILVLVPFSGSCTRRSAEPASQAETQPSTPGEVDYRIDDPRLRFIKVAEVKKGTVNGITAATGNIAFDEDHTSHVGSPVSGRVEEILVKPGDRVKKGQALVTIASPDIETALGDARTAAADLALAERALERSAGLYAERAIAKKELVQAESDVVKARSNLERTRARLDLLGMKLEDHTSRFTLRSPLPGVVVERTISPGAEVRSDGGTPLFTISDLGSLWAYADIYERDLASVHAGQQAEVRVISYGARAFPAFVAHVGEAVDAQTRTVKVRLTVDNPGGELKPEMFARITLQVDSGPDVIVVPRNAVLSDGEASVVIADLGGNRFEKRKVEVGSEQDGLVRVMAGLIPGDHVVTDGALFVKAELESL
jgi:cobalt-zinc-cadmium efflux system membrane fusion protein